MWSLFEKKRNSSVELIKIIAMFLIVVSHIVQTISTKSDYCSQEYLIDLEHSTTNLNYIVLILFRHFGSIGNTLFFVSSAYFLLGKSKTNIKKAITIFLDVFLISVIFLVASLIQTRFSLNSELIIKSLLPTFFANNWYVTCYLIFLLLFPLLNIVVEHINKRTHFLYVFIGCFCCFGLNAISNGHLYINQLFNWIIIYFLIAYLKKHGDFFNACKKPNVVCLMIGVFGFLIAVLLTNYIGLKISFFNDKTLHWVSNSNPFILLMSLSLLSIAVNNSFSSSMVNFISSTSLFIYLAHENVIFSIVYRPQIWNKIMASFGSVNIVLLVLAFAFALFICSFIFAITYKLSLGFLTKKSADCIFTLCRRALNNRYENISNE